MSSFSRLLGRITRPTWSHNREVALYAVAYLPPVVGWTLTTTTFGWLYGVCYAIGVTASYLTGLLLSGFGMLRITSTTHHGSLTKEK